MSRYLACIYVCLAILALLKSTTASSIGLEELKLEFRQLKQNNVRATVLIKN